MAESSFLDSVKGQLSVLSAEFNDINDRSRNSFQPMISSSAHPLFLS